MPSNYTFQQTGDDASSTGKPLTGASDVDAGPASAGNGATRVRKPKKIITPEAREKDFVMAMIALVLALTTLPHVFGYTLSHNGFQYIGAAYNIDDYLVYLSWLQQTSHGHFFIRSLFTTDPQPNPLFNLLFWGMGQMMRAFHLSAQMVLEIVRVVGAAVLLWLIYRFYAACIPSNRSARLTAFGFACLGSGWGWTHWHLWALKNPANSPIDAWQPEAFTFTSIYVFTLFVVATILILGVLYGMLMAARTGKMRYAFVAGLCGAVLGNIHTYDILHVSAAWGLFMLVWTLLRWRRGVRRLWVHTLLALGMTLPTTLLVYHSLRTNPTFFARAASQTLSPPFRLYVAGYGIMLVFVAVAALMLVVRRWKAAKSLLPTAKDADAPGGSESLQAKEIGWADRASLLFVWCWAIAGFLTTQLHFDFQRKMLMGEDIPLCLLAGWGAATSMRRIPSRPRAVVLALIVGISFISNAFVIKRDLYHMSHNVSETSQWPVLSPSYLAAVDYIDKQTPNDAAILSMPSLSAYLPALIGRTVWVGHWSETPGYADKVNDLSHFFDSETTNADRINFLSALPPSVKYLLYPADASQLSYPTRLGVVHSFADFAANTPSYLKLIYRNKDFVVFQIESISADD